MKNIVEIFKYGGFYSVYNNDTYIFYYLFGYKIIDNRVGFPLSAYDKVKDVAVIGLPDKRLGEITGAIISVKDGMECTEEEIEEYCMKLPRYKRPKKIIFADVPRNATGKIEKPALRKKYGAEYLVAQQNRA